MERSLKTRILTNARSSLQGGLVLLWLLGDSRTQTLEHYKGLLHVEEAFCQLKDYLQGRPVFHWRPDRVVNHVRL